MLIVRYQPRHIFVPTGLLLLAAAVGSIFIGPLPISIQQAIKALLNQEVAPHVSLVMQQVRVPRMLLCLAIGAILALSGTVMQGLFRNPLADPGIIGVSGGAALGAALAIVIFAPLAEFYPLLLTLGTVPVFAFFGGSLVTFLVYQLGSNQHGTSVAIMLLAGVAISALAGAALGLLNFYADEQALRDLALWSMGSMAGATWPNIALAWGTFITLFVCFRQDANKLNAFLLGEPEARHMGIQVEVLKRRLILLCAAGVGISVSLCGMIGFVGLIIPHLGRMLVGPNHTLLLPLSALLGGLLLLIADTVSRVIVAPAELPVGIITALAGAPFFITLLFQQRGKI
ncbi:FecCD family ABC transporter permease [Motilimonas sp. 1_MG-2023]|uniref:FecCD family ABC transporter permease n=1 Tax=Motilimonas TaxID=1914248 RepID=UPI0026E42FAD|nr:iron ABC transporter permease [Motilimonas sp. 1_MG-2023]MDO6525962.1 iron ABC transporter permease [Motilimonas sp. 1_MG-2023]